MQALTADLARLFDNQLTRQDIAVQHRPHHRKWLRYYWDFCPIMAWSLAIGGVCRGLTRSWGRKKADFQRKTGRDM